MAGSAALHGGAAQLHALTVDDVELRGLVPHVLSVLVRRGADFATAEDAVQEALIRALSAWGDDPPADPAGWLITVAWRAFIDMTRSETARSGSTPNRRPARSPAPTTRCASTFCARTPTSRRRPQSRSHSARWAA